MPVPSAISDLSQTAGSNYPAGSESPSTTDDYLRTYASYIAKLRDGQGHTNAVSLASASTTDIGGQTSLFVEISGTTTITSFGTNYNGPRFIRFTGALTLTHNATSLILPTGANITTVAGDTCIAVPNQALNGWTVYAYAGKSGQFATINAAGGAFNGTVGATTPSTGAFTTVSASGNGTFNTGATGAGILSVDGAGSGSGGGAIVAVKNGGVNDIIIGNKSAILGGTYDSTATIYSAGPIDVYGAATKVSTFSSTGLAVTGSLSTTGAITLTGTPASAGASTRYISGGGTSGNFYTNVPTGSNQQWAVNESVVMALLSTGVAVTGATTSTSGFYVDTGTNAGIYSNGSSGLNFRTNTTLVGTWDSAGNLGLGVTPSAWVDDKAIQLPQGSISSGYEYGISIAAGAYRSSTDVWKYVNSVAAPMRFNINNGGFQWYTAPSGTAGNAITWTTAMTLNTNGALVLQGGNTSATGVGVAFPAAQSASSDANTLDDYEEGNWTPAIGGTATYTNQTGIYTKIGRVVIAHFDVSINAVGTGSTNVISGLPFTNSGSQCSGNISYWTASATAVVALGPVVNPSSTTIQLYSTTAASGSVAGGNAIFQNATRVIGTVTYYV